MLTNARGRLVARWMLGLWLAVAAATQALAADAAQATPQALLKARRFAELDARMSAVHAEWKKGRLDEWTYKNSFAPFFDPDPALAPLYEAWVQAMPKSYVARLAQGDFEVVRGREARGGKYAAETSESQFRGLAEANERARQALRASLALDDRPLLSYYMLMDITRHDGEDDPRELMELGLRFAPHSYILRLRYMSTLESRWGGSVDEMTAFLAECRSAGLDQPRLRALEAMVEDDEAWVARERENDRAAAVRHEQAAIELAGDGHLLLNACLSCMIKQAGWDEERLNHLERAAALYEQALARAPADGWAWGHLGYCQAKLGLAEKSAQSYKRGAELGDSYAQNEWAKVLWYGVAPVKQDRAAALPWFEKAAAAGEADAVKNLYWARKQLAQKP